MTEHTETKDAVDPKDQAAAQTGVPDAEPGAPGYYSPPDPTVGVTKSPPNEVRPAKVIAEAERIPDTRSDWDKKQAGDTGTATDTATGKVDYESYTVPELREMAEKRGIELRSDMLKDDVIAALRAAD